MDILLKITMKEHERYEIAQKLITGKLLEEEARKLMGLKSVRQVRRIKQKAKSEGLSAMIHKNRGKVSNRKLDEKLVQKALSLLKEKYHGFKPTFASEKLEKNDGIRINHETLRQLMIKAGLWKAKPRRQSKKRHEWRARKDNYGEMQQFDGSYHKWFEERGEECCLLLSVDDATGKITHGKFDKNEGVIAVFNFWIEYFEKNGFPISIYLDKFSTYKINHPSAVDNKDLKTQFERASNQVGIKLITAHTPQAKGRVERMNQTLQDRLVKEMRLANISNIKEGDLFLEKYIPEFNKKFGVIPNEATNLHKEIKPETKKQLNQIFSIQNQRRINNDYTVRFENKFYQLSDTQPTTVYKKDTVQVEKHLNNEVKIRLKNHYLRFDLLPERPQKEISIPLVALTRNKPDIVPPKNHYWRKFVINPRKQVEKVLKAV